MSTYKSNFFSAIWSKYIPVIRILIKKASTEEQSFLINRIDFERAGSKRKSGYKFMVNFVDGKTDTIFKENELVQSFISALQEDSVILEHLQKNNYTFNFTSKYQLQIKNNGSIETVVTPEMAEDVLQ